MAPKLTDEEIAAKVAKLKAEPKPNPARPECEFVDDPLNSRNVQRDYFLKTAGRLVRGFTSSLRAQRPAVGSAVSFRGDEYQQLSPLPDDATLMDWARRWHLEGGAPWIIQWARMVLHDEQLDESGDIPAVVRVTPADDVYRTKTGELVRPHDVLETDVQVTHIRAVFDPPQPRPRAYRPHRESRRVYEADVLDYLRHYMDEVVVQMKAFGPTQRPLLRREAKPFKWLVRFQILGERAADIARSEKPVVTSDAVSAAIRSLAKDIGLKKLRKDSPGRRRPSEARATPS